MSNQRGIGRRYPLDEGVHQECVEQQFVGLNAQHWCVGTRILGDDPNALIPRPCLINQLVDLSQPGRDDASSAALSLQRARPDRHVDHQRELPVVWLPETFIFPIRARVEPHTIDRVELFCPRFRVVPVLGITSVLTN
jgi:hypothetical protein